MNLISGMSWYSECRPEQKKFYSSKEWRTCRQAYITKARGLCERCLKKGIIKPGDHVHHIVELNPENMNNPDIAFNFDNLELLCIDCHNEEHDSLRNYNRRRSKKRYKIADDGKVEIYDKDD